MVSKRIPKKLGAQRIPKSGGRPPSRAQRREIKVLVIEDDECNALLFRHLLESRGYIVEVIGDEQTAQERLDGKRPDLVIIGLTLRRALRMEAPIGLQQKARSRGIATIVVSSLPAHTYGKAILDGGCDAYIEKPISIEIFLSTTEKLLMERIRPSNSVARLARCLVQFPEAAQN